MASPAFDPVRAVGKRVRTAARYERTAWGRALPLVEGQVLYESFSGNGMLDHPEAIFQELLRAQDLQHLRHVWALRGLSRFASTVERYAADPRVQFVELGSARYYDAMARSQYLVNNATFPPQFGRRDGQVYLNTWHGVPMKHMGYDIPGGGPDTRNIIRNFVSADVLLSANEFMTRQMYEKAYKLRGIYRGRILQEGSPRIDRQFVSDSERAELRRELVRRGLPVDDGREIVLYAPTWRGSFYSPDNDAAQLLRRVRDLNERIDTGRYTVLLKVHQQVFRLAEREPSLRDVLVPNDIPTNLVLAATDVLVTDYSSIWFDFLATGRPVLFHLPDEETYATTRGVYLPPARWPGPVSRDVAALADHIGALGTGGDDDAAVRYADTYAAARETYCPREDGRACARVVDVVFRGRTLGYDVRDDFADGRTSILIYLGGLRTNGITTSALSLLESIDHERFDVSAIYSQPVIEERVQNEAAINPNVRLFPRLGGMNGSKVFSVWRHLMLRTSVNAGPRAFRDTQTQLFRDEWIRCLGHSRFDHIVDFSGYSPMWAYLLLQGTGDSKSIWLHNDMLADADRQVNGRRPLSRIMRAVFSTYRYYDHLVSVSPALTEVNRDRLAAYAAPEKFVSAVNTIDYGRVLRLAGAVVDEPPTTGVAPPTAGTVTFVTVGRLSTEKNHARLIRAFAVVHRRDPGTRLVILGDGPLLAELGKLVAELGLASAVTLAGHQPNPYAVMARADCFVLSSNYEGQPMVLLEALVLGLPVVTTRFGSVAGALPEGTGLVVEQTVDALADGMQAFLDGKVPAPHFDPAAYNREAVRQFRAAIGATAPTVPAR